MTIDPDLRERIRCPATRKPLREATAAELQRVNAAIDAGLAHTRGGTRATAPVQAGLVVEGEAVLYPIVDGFPILLSSEALPLTTDGKFAGGAASTPKRPNEG
jgi:uncharacterized protein YbaR (Trm112 family)